MLYWSCWSLLCLAPYWVGLWQSSTSLMYFSFSLAAILLLLCLNKSLNPAFLAKALIFTLPNGIAVALFDSHWPLTVIYGGVAIGVMGYNCLTKDTEHAAV